MLKDVSVFYYCLAITEHKKKHTHCLKDHYTPPYKVNLPGQEGSSKTASCTVGGTWCSLKYSLLSIRKRKQMPSKFSTDLLNAFTRPFRSQFQEQIYCKGSPIYFLSVWLQGLNPVGQYIPEVTTPLQQAKTYFVRFFFHTKKITSNNS